MFERQPYHKHQSLSLAISLLGCLSLIIIVPSSFAESAGPTNPSSGDTIAQYCSTGTCHTPGGPTTIINKTSAQIQTLQQNNTVGTVNLSQSCIGNNCSKSVAVNQLGKIGLQLSQVCLMNLINHINSTCLNYNDLKVFDNTNPLWAGRWVEEPYEHRLPPKIKNHENFNPNPWVIMVDPNADYTTTAKMIIVDTHFTWTDQNASSNKGLVMQSHVDRYVSPDCNEARVGPNLALIQDTINYLESGCTANMMNDTKITTQKEIPFSYDNSYSTLHQADYLKGIMHGHNIFAGNHTAGGLGPSLCINGKTCDFKDPYKKIGY